MLRILCIVVQVDQQTILRTGDRVVNLFTKQHAGDTKQAILLCSHSLRVIVTCAAGAVMHVVHAALHAAGMTALPTCPINQSAMLCC